MVEVNIVTEITEPTKSQIFTVWFFEGKVG